MARAKKPQPTLDSIFFSTPEQKVIRFLLSEPTTAFTPRVISSKLKGVRGLGGVEGITKILKQLQELHMVDFVDNERSVRVHDDNSVVQILKTFGAICDLEGLKLQLEPICARGILFGSRATGKARSDSDYDLFVVTEQIDEAKRIAAQHPMGKLIEIVAYNRDQWDELEQKDAAFLKKLQSGIVLWGPSW